MMTEQEKVARCLAALDGQNWDNLNDNVRGYWYGQAHKFLMMMSELL